jgi:hypothetical protein
VHFGYFRPVINRVVGPANGEMFRREVRGAVYTLASEKARDKTQGKTEHLTSSVAVLCCGIKFLP